MGTLAEDLAALPARVKSRPCLTCTLPAELLQVITADRTGAHPHSFDQLSRFLATKGITLGSSAISGHFRKGHNRP